MDVAPTTSATGAAAAQASRSASTVLSSDFETFIKMLTVQMENQDPLNPMESTEFATQLATFSGVEQQVKSNDLLSALSAQMSLMGVSQLSGWIGMEGRAVAPVVFEGAPVRLTIAGDSLQRLAVSGDREEIAWLGTDASGTVLAPGTYDVTVESFSGAEVVASTPVEVHGRIIEARIDAGQTVLVMENGQEVGAASLLGLRLPRPDQ
ncbi:Basal-body rod modification protein FlgD [Roseovarius sp. THAF27]|uniref:flagellar hook capping FlgD N-terminal domain-containing protein n=1 Tax=Roseovarius sp. THAF27 TaxID=2587850 RepID=UPI0012685101|nr:flagellar hook capping FlgD N-terminal domain-containing protein [Roseovarius sp. THAF27]QFT83082.1 Basal-body rod modification protein FlgD [Roseovarius sp. THAF27]